MGKITEKMLYPVTLTLARDDVAGLAEAAYGRNMTPDELLTAFIRDLVESKDSKDRNARLYAAIYADSIPEPPTRFIGYLIQNGLQDEMRSYLKASQFAKDEIACYQECSPHDPEAMEAIADEQEILEGALKWTQEQFASYQDTAELDGEKAQDPETAMKDVEAFYNMLETAEGLR